MDIKTAFLFWVATSGLASCSAGEPKVITFGQCLSTISQNGQKVAGAGNFLISYIGLTSVEIVSPSCPQEERPIRIRFANDEVSKTLSPLLERPDCLHYKPFRANFSGAFRTVGGGQVLDLTDVNKIEIGSRRDILKNLRISEADLSNSSALKAQISSCVPPSE